MQTFVHVGAWFYGTGRALQHFLIRFAPKAAEFLGENCPGPSPPHTAPSTSWKHELPKFRACQWRAFARRLRRPKAIDRLETSEKEASMRSTALPAELALTCWGPEAATHTDGPRVTSPNKLPDNVKYPRRFIPLTPSRRRGRKPPCKRLISSDPEKITPQTADPAKRGRERLIVRSA